jgi:hypothetical protein
VNLGLKGSYFPKSTGGRKIFVEIFCLFGSGFEKNMTRGEYSECAKKTTARKPGPL